MVLMGAGGQARELLDIIKIDQPESKVFLFDNTPGAEHSVSGIVHGHIRNEEELAFHFLRMPNYLIAVGKPQSRIHLNNIAQSCGGISSLVIASTSLVSHDSTIGKGVTVMNFAMISSGTVIGEGCLINANASIHHDVIIGDFVEISPGVTLLGNVTVGANASIGAHAVVLPKVKIGEGAIVGAGAVVTSDVKPRSTVVGVPARIIKK